MEEKQLLELSPGFRFNPTEEQLVKYYLKRKLLGKPVSALLIPEVDVYKFVPWDLPQMAGWKGDQSKLYFFCPRTRKYNRVLRWCNDFGFWKTTGKDRSVRCNNDVVGKKKTLVFYRGRVPPGERTDWVMYEYRIDEKELDSCKAAPDWLVLCGIFKKNGPVRFSDMPWDGKSWKMEDISNDDMLSQDVLTTEGYLMPPTSAFLENLSVSCQAESMPSSSNITSEILDMDISSLVNSAGAVTGETLPQEFMGEDIYCFPSWSLDRDTSDLFPFEDLLPGGPSECKDKKPSEYLDIWGPENFRSTDLWQKVRDNIKYLIYLHRGYRGTVSFRSTDRWQKVRDNIQKLIYLNRGYRGPAVYQQAKDSSLQELYSEAFSWFTTVCVPVLLVDSGIYASTGPEKTLVNCRTSDSTTADDEFSLLGYSSGRLSSQYLRKLVNLLLLLTPSRTLTPNLRAESFVKVYLPGSHNVLLQDLVNLKHLDLSYSSFIKMPNLSRACKLQNLDLRGCNNLVDASSIQTLTKLEYINLKGCASLMSLPSLMALKILCSLDVSDCTNLRRLPPSLGCLSSLTTLDLSNCKRIQNLPKGILRLKSLQTLSISGCSMLMEHASRVPTSTFVNTNNGKGMFIEHWEKPRVHSSLHTSGAEAKGPGLVWTPQLHKRFVDVVAHLGIMNAVPKTIMQLMNVEGLTRDYVDSHLQKYRLYLRRMQGRVGGVEPPPGNGNGNANGSKDSNNSNNYSKRSEDAAKPSSTAQDLERIPVHHHPATSPSRPICDKSQHREVLKGYMSMPVEAIHQANAFHDVQRTVETLYEQSSDSHESESLHDLLYCLEELQENVPSTMARMHVARVSKASFVSTLAQLGSSFVRTEEQCSLLAARFLVITDQEEELDAEIERLLAKRQELID